MGRINGLSKQERLSGEKRISRLFDQGESGFVHPFRYVYLCEEVASKESDDSDEVVAGTGTGTETGTEVEAKAGTEVEVMATAGEEVGGKAEGKAEAKAVVRAVVKAEAAPNSNPATPNVAILISVSKRYHKRANKRNLNKRRIREAYRQNKGLLTSGSLSSGKSVNLALIYISKEVLDYKSIESAVKKILLAVKSSLLKK